LLRSRAEDRDETLPPEGRVARREDPERFLAALTAPADRRRPLYALIAFNQEIARARAAVSEPLIGQIRLQWWQDALDRVYAGGPGPAHEVALPLAETIRAHDLPAEPFRRLIEGRRRDLDDEPPADLAQLEDYARETAAPLARLMLRVLGCEDRAASAGDGVATAWALTGVLRAVRADAARGRVRLPADLLAGAGLDRHALSQRRPEPDRIARVAAPVAERARALLTEATGQRAPRGALPVLAVAPLARAHLRRLARAGHDPFAPRIGDPDPLRALRVAWVQALGRI